MASIRSSCENIVRVKVHDIKDEESLAILVFKITEPVYNVMRVFQLVEVAAGSDFLVYFLHDLFTYKS